MSLMRAGPLTTGIAHPLFVRWRSSDGFVWSTVTPGFEAYNPSNVANYGIAATETGAIAEYTAADPAAGVDGRYDFVAAAGSSLATSDLPANVLAYELAPTSASDPWATGLPGSYGSGTAGADLNAIYQRVNNSPTLSVVNPVGAGGDIKIYLGADYDPTGGYGIGAFTDPLSGITASLSGATVELRILPPVGLTPLAVFSGTITGSSAPLVYDFTIAYNQTQLTQVGMFRYSIWLTLGGKPIERFVGTCYALAG